MNQNLATYARQLRLSGLLSSLELRLEEARTHQLPHEQFLELIFQDEERAGEREVKRACPAASRLRRRVIEQTKIISEYK